MSYSFLIILFIIYYSYRYAWWKTPVSYQYPRILMYHMIKTHTNGKFKGLRVSPDMFERQIKYLVENNWHFFTMSELLDQRDALPAKSVAITFDDGYEDNYTNAFEILKKYSVKATIYLVVDRHNREWSSKRKSKNNSGELMHESKLSNKQVEIMLESGLIEIGSHTMTHCNLTKLTEQQKREEMNESKQHIEKNFQIQCNSFCYPFGLYDKQDPELIRSAGYASATTTRRGIDNIASANPYLLKRITISGKDNFFTFILKMRTGKRGIRK